jgi:hypothetical protein
MGARIAVEELLRHGTDLAAVREAIVGRLEQINAALQGAGPEYLLFTLVAAVVTPEEAVVFTCGDGLVGVNGEIRAIGPDEAPPYLAYALLGGEAEFIVQQRLPASGLDSLALGSDGAIELRLDALLKDELIFKPETHPDYAAMPEDQAAARLRIEEHQRFMRSSSPEERQSPRS